MKEILMMTKNKPATFITGTLDVQWAFLHKVDDKFGKPGNHNITVVVDDNLQSQLDKLKTEHNATKINGMRTTDDGVTVIKAKSSSYSKKGQEIFPCYDANAQKTEAVAFGGDKVKLKLTPMIIDRDSSMSLFLSGVQIIDKKPYEDTGGFEKTEGFDGSDYKAPVVESTAAVEEAVDTEEITDSDLPF
jgi:hypothetical protein